MRQVVEQAPFPYLVEPGLLGNSGKGEEAHGMLMENATRESRNHAKDGELPEMKECRPRKTTSKKVNNWMGGTWQETKHASQSLQPVMVDEVLFCFLENQ